jgi:hypothetical protein
VEILEAIMNQITIFFLGAIALMAGCTRPGIQGNGAVTTTNSSIAHFSKLKADGAYQIQWSSGEPSISISTDENLLPFITTSVTNDTLHIDQKENLKPTKGIRINISSASLSDVQLNGAVSLAASNLLGSELKLESNGASSMYVQGSVTNLKVNFSGAGSLKAKGLQAQSAKVSLSGACSADLTVTESLDASVSGAGTIIYGGNPKRVEKEISGSGRIQTQQ